jgi:hypothetical protein
MPAAASLVMAGGRRCAHAAPRCSQEGQAAAGTQPRPCHASGGALHILLTLPLRRTQAPTQALKLGVLDVCDSVAVLQGGAVLPCRHLTRQHVHALCRPHHALARGKAKGAAAREARPRQRQQCVVHARHGVAAGVCVRGGRGRGAGFLLAHMQDRASCPATARNQSTKGAGKGQSCFQHHTHSLHGRTPPDLAHNGGLTAVCCQPVEHAGVNHQLPDHAVAPRLHQGLQFVGWGGGA